MTVEVFLDTNVVVYAVSRHADDARKKAIAVELLHGANISTSAQVLQEFYSVVTRKLATRLTHEAAIGWLEFFEDVPIATLDTSLVVRGADISDKFKISYWDGAIIAAAEKLKAKILYTEDLNHGQFYGTVQAINPF